MINIIYRSLLIAVLIITFSGCKKFLEQNPKTEIGSTVFWKTEDDIKGV
ncbi:RagB/SusD family nutrient uptake outer membrane protein [Niabella hibiscisoli]|nr:RagB/SusD family nutrient uptake outer membrane protein [Niabella hibiscisoli]MCH5720811.1 RagB/SusD family nutrient uptake outer membrane protein [Niabella hibiscisoli]